MKSRRLLFFIALYLAPLSGTGIDLYSPSLPSITTALNTNAALVKLTLAVYLYGFAIGQLLWGTLSDIHGRKPMLLISLTTFCIASYLATVYNNIYFLLGMRVLQGIAGAGASVLSKALCSDTLSGNELKKASIYLVTVWGLGPIIAPVIGGYLQHYYSWHANFYFLAAYSFSMLLLIVTLLKETNVNLHEPEWQRIFKNYAEIFSNKVFTGSVICLGLGYSLIVIFNVFTPFLVEMVLGRTSVTYGHMAFFIGIAFLSGSFTNRVLIKFKSTTINRTGVISMLSISVVTLITMYFINMSLVSLVIPVFLIIFFSAILQANLMAYALSLFPHIGGSAAAALGTVLCIVSAFVTSLASLIHHTDNQIMVSWVYVLATAIYFLVYWFFIDRACRQSVANG